MRLWEVTISPVLSVQSPKPDYPPRVYGGDSGWAVTYRVVAGDDGATAVKAASDLLRSRREGTDEETGDVTTVLRVNLLRLKGSHPVDIYVGGES